jgi:hypothetical protein
MDELEVGGAIENECDVDNTSSIMAVVVGGKGCATVLN